MYSSDERTDSDERMNGQTTKRNDQLEKFAHSSQLTQKEITSVPPERLDVFTLSAFYCDVYYLPVCLFCGNERSTRHAKQANRQNSVKSTHTLTRSALVRRLFLQNTAMSSMDTKKDTTTTAGTKKTTHREVFTASLEERIRYESRPELANCEIITYGSSVCGYIHASHFPLAGISLYGFVTRHPKRDNCWRIYTETGEFVHAMGEYVILASADLEKLSELHNSDFLVNLVKPCNHQGQPYVCLYLTQLLPKQDNKKIHTYREITQK